MIRNFKKLIVISINVYLNWIITSAYDCIYLGINDVSIFSQKVYNSLPSKWDQTTLILILL